MCFDTAKYTLRLWWSYDSYFFYRCRGASKALRNWPANKNPPRIGVLLILKRTRSILEGLTVHNCLRRLCQFTQGLRNLQLCLSLNPSEPVRITTSIWNRWRFWSALVLPDSIIGVLVSIHTGSYRNSHNPVRKKRMCLVKEVSFPQQLTKAMEWERLVMGAL